MALRNQKFKHILITGLPGVGKTTAIQKICEFFKGQHINIIGFYTTEIRDERGTRIGFDAVNLDGETARLARDSNILQRGETTKYKVGKYVVFVDEFGKFMTQLYMKFNNIEKSNTNTILVIDEIGKMELLNKEFGAQIQKYFSFENLRILATVPCKGITNPILDKIKKDGRNYTITVTKENRNTIVEEILEIFDM